MATALERPRIERPSAAAPRPGPGPAPGRFVSLDAYRGLIMLGLVSRGFGFPALAGDPRFAPISRQFDHVAWTGMVFWDLIQPAFMFMVGMAMPFSFARRRAAGAREGEILRRSEEHTSELQS